MGDMCVKGRQEMEGRWEVGVGRDFGVGVMCESEEEKESVGGRGEGGGRKVGGGREGVKKEVRKGG